MSSFKMPNVDAATLVKFKASLSQTASVVTRGSQEYEGGLKRWSVAAEKPAGIVVFPSSAEDVSKTVLFSKANRLEFAVCGGGHGTSGASSTDGGLCINLARMRGVVIDPEKKTITAQGGALWADVDTAAGRHKIATVGGTVNTTGIGGLSLGGGYGHLSGQYGLVVDNIVSVELVLADGNIVIASGSENPELFWAARGAGASFGVATSFTYQAYDQKNEVWGGLLVFPTTVLNQIVKFTNHFLSLPTQNHSLFWGFTAPPPANVPVILALLSYIGPEDDAKALFEPLLSLGPLMDTTRVMTYPALNAVLNDSMPPGLRRSMKGSAFMTPLTLEYAQSLLSNLEDLLQAAPDATATVILLECLSYQKILEVPQTATAFANRGAYGNMLVAPGWTDEESDFKCREWTRKIAARSRAVLMEQIAVSTDNITKTAVGEYVNYDSLDVGAQQLFGVNFPRLALLKRQYDPENMFCRGPNMLA